MNTEDEANHIEGMLRKYDLIPAYGRALMRIRKTGYDEGFKAGQEECAEKHFAPDWPIKAKDIKDATEEGRRAGKQEGREEVVEFVEANLIGGTQNYIGLDGRKWQAQKKAWGIEVKND